MEQIIFNLLMFCTGCLFGSFFTLAVYRIPLHKDITHENSFCPNCNHKLSFLDLIPVLSYIFLGGKCRYCKQKIRIRYLLLEIFTGLVFLLFGICSKISFTPLNINKLIFLIIALLYIAGMIIIAGIDKERKVITKSVFLYEIFVVGVYMVYLCIVEETNIYRYAIYLILLIIFLIFDTIMLKKKKQQSYLTQILELSTIMLIFSGEITFLFTAILSLLFVLTEELRTLVTKKEVGLKIGFYLVCSNIISIILVALYRLKL